MNCGWCPAVDIGRPLYDRAMVIASDVAAFVLAGGRSMRMGTDKAFVILDGCTLLARALELTRSITNDVHIVGDAGKFASFAPVVEDIFPGCGPLGGIHAALRASQQKLNLIMAVDLPFISPALLQCLLARARGSASATVTVPRCGKGWQPLCAIYRREFVEEAEKALRGCRYKIDALFDPATTQVITEEELQAAGFSLTTFRNINTPQELSEAHQ